MDIDRIVASRLNDAAMPSDEGDNKLLLLLVLVALFSAGGVASLLVRRRCLLGRKAGIEPSAFDSDSVSGVALNGLNSVGLDTVTENTSNPIAEEGSDDSVPTRKECADDGVDAEFIGSDLFG